MLHIISLEALDEIKTKYFTGNEDSGYEPFCGLFSVTDGTMRSIGHLIGSSICNGGPGPGFFAPWLFSYVVGGFKAALPLRPATVPGSKFTDLYAKVQR